MWRLAAKWLLMNFALAVAIAWPVHTRRGVPFVTSLGRVLIPFAVLVGLAMLALFAKWRYLPGNIITITPAGVDGIRNRGERIRPADLLSIGVEPEGATRFALHVLYRSKSPRPQRRVVWLDDGVDPVALETFMREQGWPVERAGRDRDEQSLTTTPIKHRRLVSLAPDGTRTSTPLSSATAASSRGQGA